MNDDGERFVMYAVLVYGTAWVITALAVGRALWSIGGGD